MNKSCLATCLSLNMYIASDIVFHEESAGRDRWHEGSSPLSCPWIDVRLSCDISLDGRETQPVILDAIRDVLKALSVFNVAFQYQIMINFVSMLSVTAQ